MKAILVYSISLMLLFPLLLAQDFDVPVINPFSLTTQGARSSPFLVDIDNDGDLDMFTGYVSGDFGFYDNIGFANAPNYGPVVINPFNLTPLGGSTTPLLADLDDDGDFDMMTGSNGGLRYYENQGNANVPSFGPAIVNPFGILDPSGNNKPDLADIDNDDDLDLFVGTTDGNTYYFENTGTANNPAFAASVTNPFGLSDVGTRSAPEFVDIDTDGDLDVIIGSQNGQFHYFENIGTANAPNFSFVSENPFNISSVGQDAKPNLADLDFDGDVDLLSGNAIGEYYYFENIAPLGIEDRKGDSIRIYPNPFSEFTYIQLKEERSSDLTIFVTDVTGRIISSGQVYSENGRIVFYRGELNTGIYLLFLEDDISTQFLGKVVVN